MLTRHSRGPAGSRVPVRTRCPELSRIVMVWRLMTAVQPASHNFPRLMRLLVNPGTIQPVRAATVGKVGRANWAKAMEVNASPVAVRMVAGGAELLWWRRGAVSMK
jgi:hypothetical protein